MRRVRIAEWILELVTTRERAASLAGDLVEDGPGHGVFWFWATVVRAAGTMLWREFASDWKRMLRLGAAGLIVEYLGMLILLLLVSPILGLMGMAYGSGMIPKLISGAFGLSAMVVSQFAVGWWMARRTPGRELVPCAALIGLDSLLTVVVNLVWSRQTSVLEVLLGITAFQIVNVSLFAGAVTARRRRMS